MRQVGSYYLVDQETGKALAGPMPSQTVVDIIDGMGGLEERARYYNASRYILAKIGSHPNNKAGNLKLAQDLGGKHGKD